jgi:sigma-B regulation protein RsbU (phosphoserine phosphatase)
MTRILIVEDDPAILRGLRENLTYEAYDVVTASSGERAYQLIHERRPDLILMDVMLPGVWGDELCRRVRAEGITTPIVMLTARSDESNRVDGLDGGADDYISKPFAIREVSARIRSILRNRRGSAVEHQRLSREMRLAAEVQQRWFPVSGPTLRTLDCAGSCRPAREVGGDYYDHLMVGDGQLALVLADVAGKGMPAALLMASVHGHLRAHAPSLGADAGGILASVNGLLFAESDGARYATCFYGVYDDRTRALRYVNAGHPPALIISVAGDVRLLEATASPAGMFHEIDRATNQVHLQPGDWLIVCSDGVGEAANRQNEEFGDRRIVDVVRGHGHETAERMCAAILDTAEAFAAGAPRADDMTVLAAKLR